MTTDGIVVRDLARAFGAVRALRQVDFDAPAGAVTALIGPNGSGKTTLMLMLASLLRPDAGSIRVAGLDPVSEPVAVRARLGWMPDALGSWNVLTVRSALETTGRLYRLGHEQAASRAAELIALVGLDALANQQTRVLSRGQKQKLSLARALVHDPEVLLLDEPASGLDPAARVDLQRLVRQLAAEGKTVLISSHVLAELDEIADGAVYLEAGSTVSAERIARAKVRLRQWRIRSSDPAALRAALEGETVVEDRDDLLVALEGESAASALLRRLVLANVPISTFAPALGDLEHTFLDLNRTAEDAS